MTFWNSINYYAPQIFQQIGLTGPSAGLFATGVYGVVKIVVTAIGLMAFTEQLGRKVGFFHIFPAREALYQQQQQQQQVALRQVHERELLTGSQWSLLIGSAGQAFAMFYIGVNQAVHPPTGVLDGNAIFAIICVYLFVVFYSFGWGPTPFILSSECAPNHIRSLIMAAALMTQWLFNFVIAKIT